MIGLDFGLGALEQDMWRVVFLMTRRGAALLAAPFFGASAVPVSVRVAMTGALAIFVSIWMPQVQTPEALISAEGMLAIAGEVIVGLALGFVLQLAFAAPTVAAELINANPNKYAHYFLDEVKGLLEPDEFQGWRLLYGPPMPYTRARFDDTYQWMLGYPDLIEPGSTYEQVVDNRAWE